MERCGAVDVAKQQVLQNTWSTSKIGLNNTTRSWCRWDLIVWYWHHGSHCAPHQPVSWTNRLIPSVCHPCARLWPICWTLAGCPPYRLRVLLLLQRTATGWKMKEQYFGWRPIPSSHPRYVISSILGKEGKPFRMNRISHHIPNHPCEVKCNILISGIASLW